MNLINILKDNDICWCGSSISYKFCHKGTPDDSIGQKILYERVCYTDSWCDSAEDFRNQQCYDWMASQLKKFSPKKIFDIGCGDGSGLVALVKNLSNSVHTLVSIEENRFLLETAEKHLKLESIFPIVYKRINTKILNGKHFSNHGNIAKKKQKGVFLIESEFISDPNLLEYLLSQGKFDAVTIWLIGTYPDKKNSIEVSSSISSDYEKFPGEYRLQIQNKAYELADKILNVGGVLQAVDRSPAFSTDPVIKADIINSHNDQASVTNLEFVEITEKSYEQKKRGIQMIQTKGTSGRSMDTSKLSLKSVIFKKKF